MRLVSLLATAAMAWCTAKLARAWLGELQARLAPWLLLGSVMLVEIGGRLQLDPLLAALCLGALTALALPAADPRAAARRVWLAGLLTGLAILTKGPVALLHVVLPLVLWRRFAPRCPARAPASACASAPWR
ncbi:MAG: glycosyltransferase family 39 protein [Planctomycetota bacterium]